MCLGWRAGPSLRPSSQATPPPELCPTQQFEVHASLGVVVHADELSILTSCALKGRGHVHLNKQQKCVEG
jgi:hypothetical protein